MSCIYSPNFVETIDGVEYVNAKEKLNFFGYIGCIYEKQTQLNNGIMACAPKHPSVEVCVEAVRNPKLGSLGAAMICPFGLIHGRRRPLCWRGTVDKRFPAEPLR